MKNLSTISLSLTALLLVACNSTSNGSGNPATKSSSSKSKVSVLSNPKGIAIQPSGYTTATLEALSELEKQSWFSEGVKKTWERECISPKSKSFPRNEQGVLSFVGGTEGIWGIQCSNGQNYFVLLPIDPTDKVQYVSCEGDIAKANLCRKF